MQCANGWGPSEATNFATCRKGTLTMPTLTCHIGSCRIGTELGNGVVGAHINGCVADSEMASHSTCDVACKDGFSAASGSSQYSCTQGVFSPATLACAPASCNIALAQGMIGSESNGCGSTLESKSSCQVKCTVGYTPIEGTREFRCSHGKLVAGPSLQCIANDCTLERFYGHGIISSTLAPSQLPCNLGGKLRHAQKCFVRCAPGYTYVSGSTSFECHSGDLTAATLTCRGLPCTVPSFMPGLVGHTTLESAGCMPGQVLQHNSTCSAMCDTSGISPYFYTGSQSQDTMYYGCKAGVLTHPRGSCQLDYCDIGVLGKAYKQDPQSAQGECYDGLILAGGHSCSPVCADGYDRAMLKDGRDAFYCKQGNLLAADVTCAPRGCVLPSGPAEGWQIGWLGTGEHSGCLPGAVLASGQACHIACAPGYVRTLSSSETAAEITCEAGILTGLEVQCEIGTVAMSCRCDNLALSHAFECRSVPIPQQGKPCMGAVFWKGLSLRGMLPHRLQQIWTFVLGHLPPVKRSLLHKRSPCNKFSAASRS